MLTDDYPPTIVLARLPEKERQAAGKLRDALNNMFSYVSTFEAAIALYDFCEAQRDIPNRTHKAKMLELQWSLIAARDGAMTLYHFTKSFGRMMEALKECPTLQLLINMDMIQDAGKTLKSSFHKIERIRHAVAHGAELSPHDPSGITIVNSLLGRNFTTTFEGVRVSYEISAVSLANLRSVKCPSGK